MSRCAKTTLELQDELSDLIKFGSIEVLLRKSIVNWYYEVIDIAHLCNFWYGCAKTALELQGELSDLVKFGSIEVLLRKSIENWYYEVIDIARLCNFWSS